MFIGSIQVFKEQNYRTFRRNSKRNDSPSDFFATNAPIKIYLSVLQQSLFVHLPAGKGRLVAIFEGSSFLK